MGGSPTFAGVELGGTKVVCVIGSGPDAVTADVRIPTTAPDETLGAVVDFLLARVDTGTRFAGVGVASFGPVERRPDSSKYGWITTTPKPGWSDTDVLGPIADRLGVPARFDTDVNGAALAEGRWGAAAGLSSFVYLTVGTGIGGGAVVDGALPARLGGHPEMGHVAVPRHPDDGYRGGCPFHGDCLEGMAAGPAIEARWGMPGDQLDGETLAAAVEMEAHYLAAGLRNVVYTVAPERILIGGGVAQMPGLMPAVRSALADQLAGYPGLAAHGAAEFVSLPGLGAMAGPAGALALAEAAYRAVEAPRV